MLLDLLLPDECCVCHRRGANPCVVCAHGLPDPPEMAPPALLDACAAVVAYEDTGADLVRALKYANRRGSLPWLADQMAAQVGLLRFDVVTWVPSSTKGKRARGYEPGGLFAEAIGKRLRVPVLALLQRDRRDYGQTAQHRAQRLQGPALQLRRGVPGARVLLVDDVSTTGASLTAAARVLRDAGATYVHGAVIARTP